MLDFIWRKKKSSNPQVNLKGWKRLQLQKNYFSSSIVRRKMILENTHHTL